MTEEQAVEQFFVELKRKKHKDTLCEKDDVCTAEEGNCPLKEDLYAGYREDIENE